MKLLRSLFGLLLWLAPAICGILGWSFGGWLGAITGAAVGFVGAIAAWCVLFYFVRRAQIQRSYREVSALPTEELRKIAADPASRQLGFAMGELKRRGIEMRPSLESILALLTSDNSGRRGVAMGLMSVMYPSVWSKISDGSSSWDSSEVWRARIASLDGSEKKDSAASENSS
jgi:hypothetical protein